MNAGSEIANNATDYLDYGAMGLHALLLVFIVGPLIIWLAKSMKSSLDRNIADLRKDLEDAHKERDLAVDRAEKMREAVDRLADVMSDNTSEVRSLKLIFDQRIKPRQ